MRTIWKFILSTGVAGEVTGAPVLMPGGAIIRHFGLEAVNDPGGGGGWFDRPVIWAEVDPNAPTEPRTFVTVGTGHPLEQIGAYVGTYRHPPFVWHVYESAASVWKEWPGDLVGDPPADARGDTVVEIETPPGVFWEGPSNVVDWHQRCRYRIATEQPDR